MSNVVVPSDRCSPGDMLSEFEGMARCSGRMDRSDQDHLYFFSKCKHESVMEFCITLVRCNHVHI